MKGTPVELILTVLFALMVLTDLTLRWLRKKRRPLRIKGENVSIPILTVLVPSPVPQDEPRVQTVRVADPGAGHAGPIIVDRHSRGVLRHGLLDGRRAVQDGIVAATILRPCLAHRPYDAD